MLTTGPDPLSEKPEDPRNPVRLALARIEKIAAGHLAGSPLDAQTIDRFRSLLPLLSRDEPPAKAVDVRIEKLRSALALLPTLAAERPLDAGWAELIRAEAAALLADPAPREIARGAVANDGPARREFRLVDEALIETGNLFAGQHPETRYLLPMAPQPAETMAAPPPQAAALADEAPEPVVAETAAPPRRRGLLFGAALLLICMVAFGIWGLFQPGMFTRDDSTPSPDSLGTDPAPQIGAAANPGGKVLIRAPAEPSGAILPPDSLGEATGPGSDTALPPIVPSAPAETIFDGDWGPSDFAVQIGSFGTDEQAMEGWRGFEARHSGEGGLPRHRIEEVTVGTAGKRHRLQLGPFATRAEAAAYCTSLAAAGEACLIVPPTDQRPSGG